MSATVILGRDGMGAEATEADFYAWVAYVCEHIDEATGQNVDVEIRGVRDVQDDAVRGTLDPQPIRDVLQSLWEAFCADPSAWPGYDAHAEPTHDAFGHRIDPR